MATYQPYLQFQVRESKRNKIEHFFNQNIGKSFNSQWLHGQFGSSVRTRISEINRDLSCDFRIVNECVCENGVEVSSYRAELK